MDPVYMKEGVMAVVGRMMQHLPVVRGSLRKPPARELLSGTRRTVYRCEGRDVVALGRADGPAGLSQAFAGVQAGQMEELGWWCISLDPSELRAPTITRLFPRDAGRSSTKVRAMVREAWDDEEDGWVLIPGAPRLLQRGDLH